MRISDWSSDVCSSDLHRDLYGRLTAETQATITAHYQHRHGQVLSEDLPGYADLFVKYRYAYELEGAHETDISGVAQLASSLYETLAELRPDLVQSGFVHDRITAPHQGIPIVVDGDTAASLRVRYSRSSLTKAAMPTPFSLAC